MMSGRETEKLLYGPRIGGVSTDRDLWKYLGPAVRGAGGAAVTAGADAAGEFNEVGLRGDAVRDLRGSFEIGEIDSLAPESSSSLQLSATISLPSRDAAEAAAGWLESAAPGTIAEAVCLHLSLSSELFVSIFP